MTHLPELTFTPLAESALLVRIGDGQVVDPDVVASVWALTAALDERGLTGVDDVVPAYATILVSFDLERTDHARLEQEIREVAAALPEQPDKPVREVVIPVVYGEEFGPDLAAVAAHTGLSQEDVVARHVSGDYRVACGGFAPGWDYLMGLPPELATPRLANPRTRIPPGSVGIGGMQTGIYPLETPGGWRLIGRTPLRMFDPDRDDPFLLHPADAVKFRRIDARDFQAFTPPRHSEPPPVIPSLPRNLSPLRFPGSEGYDASAALREIPRQARNDGRGKAIRVVQPGMLTTVQDLGRLGMARYGVAPGGALDRTALILGNRLVGNDPGEAGLEITLFGPTLAFDGEAVITVTGADLGAELNGAKIPLWEPIAIAAGDEVSFRPETGKGVGARAYLCVAGGLAIESVLGSRGTDLVGHFGGFEGRAVRAGDELPLRGEAPSNALLRRRLTVARPTYEQSITARVTFGPQRDRFIDKGIATFLNAEYQVSTKANRTGIRLAGAPIAHANGADLVSEGIAHGAIQVPGDGQPIVLLAARQTVGGYVKIATVIGADLDRFAQLRPGAAVRFVETTPDRAREETLRSRLASGPDAVAETSAVYAGWRPETARSALEGTLDVSRAGAWDPAGVIRVIEAARAAEVSSFRFELADVGLKLELQWSGPVESSPTSGTVAGDDPAPPGDTVVTAPVLGVFYRRGAPDQPVLVEEGATVAAGQTIALLEVMKTYHEVQAPRAGTLVAFLAEDGQFVEYGQPIARLAPLENDDDSR